LRSDESYGHAQVAAPDRAARVTPAGIDASDRQMLERLQRETFEYFLREANPRNGLIADKTEPGSPSSIAAIGLGLSAYCVAVERGWMSRATAISRTLATLRFFLTSVQSTERDATGYRGFYYHFLDMNTGRRAWRSELSTIDTAFLIAGAVTVGSYFAGASNDEREIRAAADALYRRVDWAWVSNDAGTIGHGWTPESGFLTSSWNHGYSEALLLYVLALGSPTFSIAPQGYREWTATFERKTVYDIQYLYAGPLFIHQLSHIWLDFRGIRDDRNKELDCDYFENSRRATLVQRQYAIENPREFVGYSKNGWGFTASDGPGPAVRTVAGMRRKFFGYLARGAPFGPDDGTISPWAVVASLPFAPEVVCETIRHAIEQLALGNAHRTGFDASYNATFPGKHGWVSHWKLGLNEGPIVLMIENYLSELLWNVFRRNPYVVAGLCRAGFGVASKCGLV
jgi:hypothetical protein